MACARRRAHGTCVGCGRRYGGSIGCEGRAFVSPRPGLVRIAMEVPERLHVHLFRRADGWRLMHAITKECVKLPNERGDTPRLHFTDGFGYILDCDKSVWVQDILQTRLVEHEDIGFVILCGEDATTLQGALTSDKVRHVPLGEGTSVGVANVHVFDMTQPQGCRIWWGLNSIWEVVGLVGRACDWLSNWTTRWWTKKWAKLGLAPVHYRSGSSTLTLPG